MAAAAPHETAEQPARLRHPVKAAFLCHDDLRLPRALDEFDAAGIWRSVI